MLMKMPMRFLWSQISYVRNKKLRPYILEAGLSIGQPKVLDYLSFHEGCTQKEIAKGCGVEPATISGILDGLVKKEFIQKNVSAENRRECQIFFTEKGRNKHKKIREKIEILEEQAFKGFSEDEMSQFHSFLERYYQALNDEK